MFKIISGLFSVMLGMSCLFVGCSKTEHYDICIYGATSSGIIAGYTAMKSGMGCIVIEPTRHIGGLTSGGLGETDIGNKDAIKGLARDFYRHVGRHYGEPEKWKFEPKVASGIFNDYIAESNLEVRGQCILIDVEKKGTKIVTAKFKNRATDEIFEIKAKIFIDCTYEGDLMASSGVQYTVGRESREKFGEKYNGVYLQDKKHQFPDNIDPYKIKGDTGSGLLWGISDKGLAPQGKGDTKVQAYNFRVCLTDSVGNMVPITCPENYNPSRYELLIRLMESGDPKTQRFWNYFLWNDMPNRKTDINNWGGFSTDMIGENWDYPEASFEERQEIIKKHKDYTLGLFYFMANDSRVPDNIRNDMGKWGLPEDEYVEFGHFSPQLYVREARRMVGELVMTEHHCLGKQVVSDPVAMASYTMDSHNCQRLVVNGMVKNEGNVEIGNFPPYPISYRALLPKRTDCTNLLVPVCLSASHIAFGSIRMEPVFMNLGQMSSLAARLAIIQNKPLHDIDVPELQQVFANDPYMVGTKRNNHR